MWGRPAPAPCRYSSAELSNTKQYVSLINSELNLQFRNFAGGLHREAGGSVVRVRGSGGSVAGLVCSHTRTLPREDCQDNKQCHHLQVINKCAYIELLRSSGQI